MTANKQQLREQAESVMHWSSSLTAAWPSDPDFNDVWAVGAIDEDGNRYPVIEVDAADQYDSPGDSEGIAQFFSAASPESVLRLLDEIEALQAECEKMRKDAARYQSLLEAVLREIPHRKGNRGNAPGHAHSVPGIWDEDNGALAGKECAWCKVWNEAVSAMQEENK